MTTTVVQVFTVVVLALCLVASIFAVGYVVGKRRSETIEQQVMPACKCRFYQPAQRYEL